MRKAQLSLKPHTEEAFGDSGEEKPSFKKQNQTSVVKGIVEQ